MKGRRAIFIAILLGLATPAFAHRLDEYLQAATVSMENNRVALQLRLTPGVTVTPTILTAIDTNGDGAISEAEQRAYGEQVCRDLSLTIGSIPQPLRLVSSSFPTIAEMTKGLGDIMLTFEADVPRGDSSHRLTFENHHQSAIAVYLVNCLLPRDPDIHIVSQKRNYNQSFYQLDFTVGNVPQTSQVATAPLGLRQWLEQTGNLSVVETYFCHGIHHILTGYDHLLFVSAFVLAAATLWDLVKVVTTFTIAHTITLTLAAFNLVHLPEHIVEPLISASIVFIAAQNTFWPTQTTGWSRLVAVFFFGLFHGLGFAGGLLDAMHAMAGATVTLALLGFSLGVEAGHQAVVLPLFAFLKMARHTQRVPLIHARLPVMFQRVGSAGICVAGTYYLCLACFH